MQKRLLTTWWTVDSTKPRALASPQCRSRYNLGQIRHCSRCRCGTLPDRRYAHVPSLEDFGSYVTFRSVGGSIVTMEQTISEIVRWPLDRILGFLGILV